MAQMHPVSIENYNYTYSEKVMYDRLKRQLPDKYHVFYSVRWIETVENPYKRIKIQSECDFLVFDPNLGFITIEVKGGKSIKVDNGNWVLVEESGSGSPQGSTASIGLAEEDDDYADSFRYSDVKSRNLRESPYDQAEKSMRYFKDYFEKEFKQTYRGVYGSAVAFPMFVIDSKIAHNAPKELTIDKNDMPALHSKINQIFRYWKNNRNITTPFTPEQRVKFLAAINKQISMGAAAGALIEIKEKEFAQINLVQDSILDCLQNYQQVRIIGGAGTGKTYIGMKKAKRDAAAGKRVLFTCGSGELAAFVKKQLEQQLGSNSAIDIRTYDELVKKPPQEKYDSVIVDEAQDFDDEMGFTVRNLLRDENASSIYVFYDKNQNLFNRKSENAFLIDAPPYILKYNIRNTGSIYKYATDRTDLGLDTVANNIEGVKPETSNYTNPALAVKELGRIVNRLVQHEGVATKSIVIVSDLPYAESVLAASTTVGDYKLVRTHHMSVAKDEVCFKTAEEFKGQEAEIIIYLTHEPASAPAEKRNQSKDYVAITRAKYYLYVLNIRNWH